MSLHKELNRPPEFFLPTSDDIDVVIINGKKFVPDERDAQRDAIEDLRLKALKAVDNKTDENNTYSDGYANGLIEALRVVRLDLKEILEPGDPGEIRHTADGFLQYFVGDASDLLDRAWVIIANSSGGNWKSESKEWQEAAKKWRNDYHNKKVEVMPKNDLPIDVEIVRARLSQLYEGKSYVSLYKEAIDTIYRLVEYWPVKSDEIDETKDETIVRLRNTLDKLRGTLSIRANEIQAWKKKVAETAEITTAVRQENIQLRTLVAQKNENIIEELRKQRRIEKQTLIVALEQYADLDNWWSNGIFKLFQPNRRFEIPDCGLIARKALGRE